ncbi:hypothetical protein [Terrisporobacter petrolearius]
MSDRSFRDKQKIIFSDEKYKKPVAIIGTIIQEKLICEIQYYSGLMEN